MGFSIDFMVELLRLVFYGLPLFIAFILAISALGVWIGKMEGWCLSDSLYFAFITATTVGYGDFHPEQSRCKYLAILIALLGLIFTGVLVAVAVEAVGIVVDTREMVHSSK